MNATLVTTFHQKGLDDYAQKFIESFEKNTFDIPLIIYAEDCDPLIESKNITCYNQKKLKKLIEFKNRWKNVPKANGKCPPEIKAKRPKDWHKEFKWDAVRFANKVYAVFDAANKCNTDWIVWIDADTIIHSKFNLDDLMNFLPSNSYISYLGRERKWPECGFYGINLKTEAGNNFLTLFEKMYEDAENGIFKLQEWHDSFVFDYVLTETQKQYPNESVHNISEGLIKGEGHPFINSELGKYIDHLKGNRKELGKSKPTDLIIKRNEQYWSKI